MNAQFENGTIGDIVANNYRAAAVFERYGLDFCCGGRSSLAEACHQQQVDLSAVVAELELLGDVEVAAPTENPVELVDHILSRHHAYVRGAIPVIHAHLAKVNAVHGARHQEIAAIERHFEILSRDLAVHMVKEEQVLFPYIRMLAEALADDGEAPPDIFGTVQNPIRMMESEHQRAGDEMGRIRALTSGYQAPEDACTTYRLVFEELREFERDLHRHVHLENNVLFPKAVALEAQAGRQGHIGCELPR